MSDPRYDLVVIGGGPGGYVAAIRAAQLGLKVACVEKRGALGGTCLNVGCIPSKALLHASELFDEARNGMAAFGVKAEKVSLDLAAMMASKDQTVADLSKGIEFLFKKNKIDLIVGTGRIMDKGSVEISSAGSGSTSILRAGKILIATGSEVTPLPGVTIDERHIVSSTGALTLPKVPKHLVVIGGGVIGLELGQVWRRLGAEVTVIEFLDRVLPLNDGEVSKLMARVLKKQGFALKLSTKVTGAKTTKTGVTLAIEAASGGAAEALAADVALVAIGRRPHTEGLGLDKIGVRLDKAGRIVTDVHYRTSVEGVYAIGDVIAGPMLAHKAEDEGIAVAEILANKPGHVNYGAIPSVVYTKPEVASVGQTEEQLKERGVAYKVGKFPMTANSRAKATRQTEGFVKILADASTDRVLGVHIVAGDAGNMIAEAALAMEFGASAEDIARTCHAHPTEMEAIKEAALAVDSRAIHS